MIDFDKKFIFVHVTKTGGTSVEKALGGKLHDHRACRMYRKEYGKDIFNLFSSFTVVRNPWDKMVSHYTYLRQHRKSNIRHGPLSTRVAAIIKDLSFSEWLKRIQRGDKVTAFSIRHFDYLMVDGEMLVKDIIRFENLQEDFNKICLKIGVEPVELPRLNKSHHAHYSTYYDEESKNIVKEFFKKEIKYFDYKFDN